MRTLSKNINSIFISIFLLSGCLKFNEEVGVSGKGKNSSFPTKISEGNPISKGIENIRGSSLSLTSSIRFKISSSNSQNLRNSKIVIFGDGVDLLVNMPLSLFEKNPVFPTKREYQHLVIKEIKGGKQISSKIKINGSKEYSYKVKL